MDENNTPDSWEQQGDGGSGDPNNISDITKNLGGLNVHAAVFVPPPGQNVFAQEFVPTFGSTPTAADTTGQQSETSNTQNADSPSDIPMEEEASSSPVDDNAAKHLVSAEEMEGNTIDEVRTPQASTPEDWAENGGNSDSEEESDEMVEEESATKKKSRKSRERIMSDKNKDHLNIVFIGHVDAGKSTIGGHIMYLTGMVEKRTLEKYEREAKEKNRESWYLSWALDTNQEERDKGKTVEVGRAYFETDSKHFTILDAPGHKSFVPNMIGGASQADVAVLVISARRGEFETGFERGGQTREHAMLVKTAGVKHLVVVVNKMDDPTVNWDETRYEEIKEKLTPYLRKCGFNPKTDIFYLPVSGLTGANLKEVKGDDCTWYSGPSLIDYLNKLAPMGRSPEGPVRLPIVDRYKDMGTLILGKVESGTIKKGDSLTIMPNKVTVEALQLWSDEDEVDAVGPGENVKIKLKNVEEEEVSPGFVLCTPDGLCHTGKKFDAQIVILEHKSIICAGYSAVMHVHCCAEEVTIKALLCLVDRKSGEKVKNNRPRFIKQDQIAIVRFEINGGAVCLEPFKDFPQMGRFTLRDEGKTIAIGKVLKVLY